MMNKNWKYISLYFAGDRFDYIYDIVADKVYTQLFPGIEVEPFTIGCGHRILPNQLKQTIIEKLTLAELRKTASVLDYDKYF